MKQEYVNTINKQLEACDDLALLDLISMLLKKVGAVNA